MTTSINKRILCKDEQQVLMHAVVVGTITTMADVQQTGRNVTRVENIIISLEFFEQREKQQNKVSKRIFQLITNDRGGERYESKYRKNDDQ